MTPKDLAYLEFIDQKPRVSVPFDAFSAGWEAAMRTVQQQTGEWKSSHDFPPPWHGKRVYIIPVDLQNGAEVVTETVLRDNGITFWVDNPAPTNSACGHVSTQTVLACVDCHAIVETASGITLAGMASLQPPRASYTESDIANCSFCGSFAMQHVTPSGNFECYCFNEFDKECGETGPACRTSQEAVDGWNDQQAAHRVVQGDGEDQ